MRPALTALRAARNIAQEQVAIAAGASRQMIYALENNRSGPFPAVAFALARYFTRPVESVFYGGPWGDGWGGPRPPRLRPLDARRAPSAVLDPWASPGVRVL